MKVNKVTDFYADKCVFLTGGSGFLGLSLIEKLLRVCPQISCIFVLLRPKKGSNEEQRFADLRQHSVFVKLLEQNPNALDKIKIVSGDVGQPNLGLSQTDESKIVSQVNLIYHLAATLDFEASLKTTMEINYLGTQRVLEMAAKCKELEAFVHVSSAYANSFRLDCHEQLYQLMAEPEDILKIIQESEPDQLEKKTPNILQTHPNTYTFSKQMAEHEVKKFSSRFRCTIVRPSMITGAWKEPIPGWTCSKNGPAGFFMGAARGIVRRLPVGEELIYDYIPVDIVINTLIASAYYIVQEDKHFEIYHCTSSTRKPFRWIDLKSEINPNLQKWPIASAIWYPSVKLLPSVARYRFSAIFVHFIPAYMFDVLLTLLGRKRILVRLHKRVNESLNRLSKFIYTEWKFHTDNLDRLQNYLSDKHPENVLNFNLSLDRLNWRHYIADMVVGVRLYLNNENLKTLAMSRRKKQMFYCLHKCLQALLFYMMWTLVSSVCFGAKCYWTKIAITALIYHVIFDVLL